MDAKCPLTQKLDSQLLIFSSTYRNKKSKMNKALSLFTFGFFALSITLISGNNNAVKQVSKHAKMDELESARLQSYKFSAFAAFNMEIEKELHDMKKSSSKIDKLHKDVQPLQFSAFLSALQTQDPPSAMPTVSSVANSLKFQSAFLTDMPSVSPATSPTLKPIAATPVCFLGAHCFSNGTNPCISGTYCSDEVSPSICLLDNGQDLTLSCTANHADCSAQSTCCSGAFTCSPVGNTKICTRMVPPLCNLPQSSLAKDEL